MEVSELLGCDEAASRANGLVEGKIDRKILVLVPNLWLSCRFFPEKNAQTLGLWDMIIQQNVDQKWDGGMIITNYWMVIHGNSKCEMVTVRLKWKGLVISGQFNNN